MSAGIRAAPQRSRLSDRPGIYDSLVAAAGEDPGHIFLRDGRTSVTYAELLARADVAAARLGALGIGPGSRVVLWLPNGADFAEIFFACARMGAIAVMAGTRLRAIDLSHILEDSGASALVFAPRFMSVDYDAMVETAVRRRTDATAPLHLLSIQPSVAPGARLFTELPASATPPVFRDSSAPAVVCYTSGTTGHPKGCLHSQAALVRNGTAAVSLLGLSSSDRIVCPVPFAHVFGFHMGVLQTVLAGATLVNAEPYDPDRLLDLVADYGGTVLYGVPTMARETLVAQAARQRDLHTLRVALVAGAPVSSRLRRAIRAPDGLACDFSVVYGCTEAPTLTQLTPNDRSSAHALDSVGRATEGVHLRILVEGTTDVLPDGEVGEIAVRGYNCMLGYLDDTDGTAAKHRDGWLITGDLGWLDSDGYLHLVGRAGEMFLVGGFNAYPREIEAQLEEFRGIAEAAVVGVPDERLGSVAMAWVTVSCPGVGEQDVLRWAATELASYKRPRFVKVVESLPRTSNGKVSRVKLEKLAQRALPQLAWEARDR